MGWTKNENILFVSAMNRHQNKLDFIIYDTSTNSNRVLFTETDKYLLQDFPVSEENKNLIQNYRTQLRDLPETYSSEEPKNIVFDENGNVTVNGTQVINKPSF